MPQKLVQYLGFSIRHVVCSTRKNKKKCSLLVLQLRPAVILYSAGDAVWTAMLAPAFDMTAGVSRAHLTRDKPGTKYELCAALFRGLTTVS